MWIAATANGGVCQTSGCSSAGKRRFPPLYVNAALCWIWPWFANDRLLVRVQAKLELIVLTGTIFMILLLINCYIQPFKRTLRKRGLLLISIAVSTFFTYLTTRLLAVTPALSSIPAIMTILTIASFQWALYICAVALKKCFTLGEMCILSQAAAIVFYGSLEYIAIVVSVVNSGYEFEQSI